MNQKDARSANWISRGLFACELTTPNDGFPSDKPGEPNCTRLKRLKNSVRNCNLMRSAIDVVLNTAKSQLSIPCFRKLGSKRPSEPKVNAGAAVKHAVLNHSFSLDVAEPRSMTSKWDQR